MKTEVQKTTSRKIVVEDQINELREVYRNGNMNSVYGWLEKKRINLKSTSLNLAWTIKPTGMKNQSG